MVLFRFVSQQLLGRSGWALPRLVVPGGWLGELVFGTSLIVPFSVVLGLLSRRWAIQTRLFSQFPPLTLLYFGSIADLLVEWLIENLDNLPIRILRLVLLTLGSYLGESFQPVALTGSIATGKSTVVKLLNRYHIIDTDSIGHEILLPPSKITEQHTISKVDSVYDEILREFGDASTNNKNILDDDGQIDRRKLGAIIFQDPTQRRTLNRITHPRIIYSLLKQLLTGIYKERNMMVIADVPLLFESGKLKWLFGLTVVVVCSKQQQYERLQKRNPDLTEQQCRDRIASQLPIEQKRDMANLCINNSGNLEDLKSEVKSAENDLLRRLCCNGLFLSVAVAILGIFSIAVDEARRWLELWP